MVRGTYFGTVTSRSTTSDAEGNFYDQKFSAQSIFDASVGYDLTKNLKLSIGGSNVFNKYPDILRPENQGFYLYDNNQQGSNGSYYYGRVSFNF